MYFKSPIHPVHNLPPIKYQNEATIVDRNLIPMNVRYLGMECYVVATDIKYKLVGGLDNTFWVEANQGDVAGYQAQFVNADLVAGYYTVNHALNSLYHITSVSVMDNNGKKVEVDDVEYTDSNNLVLDLRMIEPIIDTWTVFITAISETTPPIPPITTTFVKFLETQMVMMFLDM